MTTDFQSIFILKQLLLDIGKIIYFNFFFNVVLTLLKFWLIVNVKNKKKTFWRRGKTKYLISFYYI